MDSPPRRRQACPALSPLTRRTFLTLLPALGATHVRAADRVPACRNIQWALSSALWRNLPPCPLPAILDLMQETGFVGMRLAGFPGILERYQFTAGRLHTEVSRRGLQVVSISWGGALHDPAQRTAVLASAREAMKFLADFGANHLVVFPPARGRAGSDRPAAFGELCARCNQVGELAGEMGFAAGLHNHMGEMVQTAAEIDRCMALADPQLFRLSPDTAHLNLAGCPVVATLDRYKDRIHFFDYKDSKWTDPAPLPDSVLPAGKPKPAPSENARFFASIYDLGDGQVDFPGCHRVLKSVNYRGWICVDLDTARRGALASYRRCGAYITRELEPIYS
jgi:inosose dehydratase